MPLTEAPVSIEERTLLYHLATANQKESTESYLRKRFGDEILDKLHKERLIGREPKGIYYITLRGKEVAGKIPPKGANLYAEAKKILEEGLEVKPPASPKASVTPEEQLQVLTIKRNPVETGRKLGYDIHKLSPKDVVDKGDYAEGYRYRIGTYPNIFMARNEEEIADYILGQARRIPVTPAVSEMAIIPKPIIPKAEVAPPVTPEVTRVSPTYENLTEGQILVDQAGDRWLVTGIKKEGVPGRWAYTIKGETIDLTRTRPLGEIERYYKMEQPAIPKAAPVTPSLFELYNTQYSLKQLQEMAKTAGLSPSGLKLDLLNQLIQKGVLK